jgi:hypothetical protein
MLYQGSCHCGKVQFSVEAPVVLEADRCNCSICRKGGFLHLIVPKSKFKLLTGEDALHKYFFGSGIAKHYFCKVCGCKPFYIPRSNPDGVDVNINCLDTPVKAMNISEFDGQHWEQNAHVLAHKSIEK